MAAPRIGVKRPKRVSQRAHISKTGKTSRAPTKRLVARRVKNRKQGYFPNPMKSGYGRDTIRANITALLAEGYPEKQAVAVSLEHARRCYAKRYPKGFPPPWLRRKNPTVREAAAKAAKRFQDFTGHAPMEGKVRMPDWPKALMSWGKCLTIDYVTVRDGKKTQYTHDFPANARPYICTDPDGTMIFILGGPFQFTERGIEPG
jgi:hypothetical protein